MAIKNGNLADATEINKVLLGATLLGLGNQDKISGASITHSLYLGNAGKMDAYYWDGFGSGDKIDSTNTTLPLVGGLQPDKDSGVDQVTQSVYVCEVLDNFNDSSVDATIWSTTGTVTEDTERIYLAASSSLTSNGSTGFDLKSFGGDSEVVLNINAVSGGAGSPGSTSKIIISNGITDVDLLTLLTQTYSGNKQYTVRIVVDKSAEEVRVAQGNDDLGSAIDISSVTTNWYLKFTTGDSSQVYIYFIGYVSEDSTGTVDLVSESNTFLSTKTAGVLTWDYTGTDSDIAGSLSANSGSAYTSATKNIWTTIGTSGTGAKIKLTCDLPSTIDGTTKNIKEIKMWGAYFDG